MKEKNRTNLEKQNKERKKKYHTYTAYNKQKITPLSYYMSMSFFRYLSSEIQYYLNVCQWQNQKMHVVAKIHLV
jgi:hypothetical protein